ncbi:NADPH:quinone reductase [Halobellus ruber]|uniref:NADPH:quinone reductase n=1 Tax=Halobellus ruber TaxID=2761102 RepID=A0A7J9SFX3_9EURY|nr:NADPH:quinone reductase [Halobellus ruber]MBB6644896.1 NADPH:quinone reductase [Halobellus ruber]
MRAVRYHEYGKPDVLGVDEIDRPDPDADEVLVEMRGASVNRVDVLFRAGEYGQLPLPTIPGGDGAGVVTAVGAGVDRFEEGDRVFASGMDRAEGGTFAEYAAIPETKLAHLPDGVSFEVGAALGNVGATAWTALEDLAGIQAGDRVLVHGGSGGVGHAAIQIAASSGADVVTTAGSEDVRDRLRDLGATTVLDYDSESLAEEILAATDGVGVETILDHRLEEYLDLDLQVLAEGGQIIPIMGHVPETNGVPLYTKEATVKALRMDNRPVRAPVLRRLTRLMTRGDLTAVVADTYDFTDAAGAHRDVLAGGYVGKLVVTP